MRGGPRRFRPGFPCPAVLRCDSQEVLALSRTGPLPSVAQRFHPLPLARAFVTSRPRCGTIMSGPTTPHRQRPQAIAPARFGLFPFRSPLLRESRFLSFPRATKMFQFARLPPLHLWIQCRVPAHYHGWVSPFGNPRINACSAAPRGLSQPSTSFIGSLVPRHPPCALVLLILVTRQFREHHLPLCSFQGTRGRLPACESQTAPSRRRRRPARAPGAGLSKLNSMRPTTRTRPAQDSSVDINSRRASRCGPECAKRPGTSLRGEPEHRVQQETPAVVSATASLERR